MQGGLFCSHPSELVTNINTKELYTLNYSRSLHALGDQGHWRGNPASCTCQPSGLPLSYILSPPDLYRQEIFSLKYFPKLWQCVLYLYNLKFFLYYTFQTPWQECRCYPTRHLFSFLQREDSCMVIIIQSNFSLRPEVDAFLCAMGQMREDNAPKQQHLGGKITGGLPHYENVFLLTGIQL